MKRPGWLKVFLLIAASLVLLGNGLRGDAPQSLVEKALASLVAQESELFDEAAALDDPSEMTDAFRAHARKYDDLCSRFEGEAAVFAAYGWFLARIGERQSSLEKFTQANLLDPNIPLVKNQLGNFLIEEGQYKAALPYFLAAIELEPQEPLYHYQLGNLLYYFGDELVRDGVFPRKALEKERYDAFAKAAELGPDNFAFQFRYGEAFYDIAEPDWELAFAHWEKLLQRTEAVLKKQMILLHLARVQLEMGRTVEARKLLEQVSDPSLENSRQSLLQRMDGGQP